MKLITGLLLVTFFCISSTTKATIGPDVTQKTLELPEFHSVYVNSGYTVNLKQSNKQEVTVEALTEIYNISEFVVKEGVLHINVKQKDDKNKSIWEKIDDMKINPLMRLNISIRDVKELRVNGNGKIIGVNSIASNDLFLGLAGSGELNIDIKGRAVTTKVTGTGTMTLRGYADSNNIELSGTGFLKSYACELEKAEVLVSGTGICEINVTAELKAEVYGSGMIKHKGQTKSVVKNVYGSGKVDREY